MVLRLIANVTAGVFRPTPGLLTHSVAWGQSAPRTTRLAAIKPQVHSARAPGPRRWSVTFERVVGKPQAKLPSPQPAVASVCQIGGSVRDLLAADANRRSRVSAVCSAVQTRAGRSMTGPESHRLIKVLLRLLPLPPLGLYPRNIST